VGSTIATWSWGSGPDTLVFLHALLPAATGRSIEEVALDLTTQLPMRVIGVDAPGFGQSTPRADSDYAQGHLAAPLAATAAEAGIPYVLAGHSWGAALAVRIAATRPHDVRGLVLLDGGHFGHAALPDADPGQSVAETGTAADARRAPPDGAYAPARVHQIHRPLTQRRPSGPLTAF